MVKAFILILFPVSLFAQIFNNTSANSHLYRLDKHQVGAGIRGSLSFGIQSIYDESRNLTYTGLGAPEPEKGTSWFEYDNSIKDLRFIRFDTIVGTYDIHYTSPGFFILESGDLLAHRQEFHNDPVRTWTGSSLSEMNDNGLSSDSLAYVTTFALEDSLYWYARGRATTINDLTNLILKSEDNGQSFSLHHRLIEFEPVDDVAPYPGVYQDFHDKSVVYFAPNKRRYTVGINFFDLAIIKTNDCVTFENIEGTYSTTASIQYSELDSFSIRSSSDTINYYLKFCGGFVDENDDVHFTYLDTESNNFYFARTESDTLYSSAIPGIKPSATSTDFFRMINDYSELVHKGGDAYDLIVYRRDVGGIYRYSTTNRFDTISTGVKITPDNFQPYVFRAAPNYVRQSGRPYILFARGYYDGSPDDQALFVYEYYPN